MPGSAVSDLAGRVLAGRYLLHGAIGTGASGRVYLAEDTRLRRRVAVKVLHAALAEDAAFLRRFRAEAQLAASLHHPHIVTVHDWGEDDVPFMVLELLEGGSLRSVLDQGELLTVAETARIGRDVASALEYAHVRGVLHRDIKPANLLFDEHGIVRVADFGLARALAEASWTEPAGAVFGTARYASPEQAQGVQLDARSDLYSLALVLVEAVTGRIPFAADTTLGTLTARTQRPLQGPEELGPLAAVVDRAGALDPNDRYPDAATMRQAIAAVGDALPPPGPLVLAGMIDRADPHPTRAVPPESTAPLFDQDAIEIVRTPGENGSAGPPDALLVETETERERRRRTGQRRLVPLVVAIVLLVTVALAAAALAKVGSAKPIEIPGFVGLSTQRAQDVGKAAGLTVAVGSARNAPDPAGIVIDQNPKNGTFSTNHHVSVVVSSGPAKVAVPNIVKTVWTTTGKQALDSAGLVVDSKVQTQYDAVVPLGTVISVDPLPGKMVLPDTAVHVVVSAGPAPVVVPDVRNLSYKEAVKALTDAKFKVKRAPKDEFSNDVKKGDVISTTPPDGTPAPFGSTVTVVVSKGQDLVPVPDLRNLSFDDASRALDARGLFLQVKGKYKAGQLVSGQNPHPGSEVVRGSDVTVTFSKSNCLLDFICI